MNRSLARNVRNLEIMDERSTAPGIVPPGILLSDTDLESTDDELGLHDKQERYLVSALTKMTALSSFSWSCNHPPISIDNIWPTLLKCQSLREIDINDNLVFSEATTEDRERTRNSVVVSLLMFNDVLSHISVNVAPGDGGGCSTLYVARLRVYQTAKPLPNLWYSQSLSELEGMNAASIVIYATHSTTSVPRYQLQPTADDFQ